MCIYRQFGETDAENNQRLVFGIYMFDYTIRPLNNAIYIYAVYVCLYMLFSNTTLYASVQRWHTRFKTYLHASIADKQPLHNTLSVGFAYIHI